MIITAGLMGCKLKNDLTLSSTFHPFAQVLCCKGKSSVSYIAMSLSFTVVLKMIFGASSVLLDSTDFFNDDFSDALVKGIRKCHPESLIEICFFHRMQKLNTPVTKYLLRPNQKYGELLPDLKEAMWDINCCKTQEQAK